MPDPLSIALILETSGGGSGRHVLDLAEGLAAAGQRVTVIWSERRAQEDFRDRLLGLSGVRALSLPMERSVGAHDLTSLRALTALLRRQGPFDVLHGHSSKAGALVRLLPRRIPGARIYTPHAFRTMDPTMGARGRRVYGTIERLLARRGDRIITVSSAEKTHARGLGIGARHLVTVVNGAALPPGADRATARAAMDLSEDEVAVGFIGRLDDQKAPLRFVEAVSLAAKQVPALRGVMIGDGALRATAEARNSAGAVRFLGWQDGPALFPGLDVFCMTSHYEAMPYTLLEALHAGVPIVSTDVGGVAETVEQDRNGFILPTACSAEDLAGPLARLAGDAGLRQSMGARALELARARTIDTMVAETLAVYRAARTT